MEEINHKSRQKPVIFLAFANDRVDDVAYLRNLPKELRGIRKELDEAKRADLCEVVERANAAIEDILDVFQDDKYKNRIAIFHYGGHANSYQLLLESLAGGHGPAYRKGLNSFLARQEGLKFIFLNGCSTQQHALELTQAGIPAVVGTSQSINDEVATNLSIRFYNGIANGASLERAWLDAEDYIKTQKGTANFRALYWPGKEEIEDRFPWDIFYKKGAEKVKDWNLPEAARNPLFGLPEIPPGKLPEEPFLFLNRYKRKHAEIFFGRSYYIRELYNRVTDKKSPPIILLYGLAGVGKSSLLDAGLTPRLEKYYTVCCARKDPKKGLLGTLEALLNDQPLPGKQGGIAETWKSIEKETQKPLVIILDQVEEVYTSPNNRLSNELEDFLQALTSIFGNISGYPQGKLILGYRKEYHPEIDEKFKNHELDRTPLFIEPLGREDIMDVVTGLKRTKPLRDKYNIKLEKDLPVIIADDLLEDQNSPVAPVLQIILTKMWETSKKDDGSTGREFKVKHYQELRKNMLLLEDFFRQQLEKLRNWNESVMDSGLVLDVLKYHTTDGGMACGRNLRDIRQSYRHRQDIIDELVQKLKDFYLLTCARRQGVITLTHDTLARVVINEYSDSNRPGQRASRILAAKIEDFKKNKNKIYLDETDLEIVEEGKSGMRALDNDEEQLLARSREHKAQSERRKKRIKIIRIALIAIIIIVAIFALWQWKTALEKTKIAKEQQERAERNSKISQANYFASKAQLVEKEDPTIALRLAEQAWHLDKNETVTAALSKIYKENSFYKIVAKHKGIVFSVAFSPDGKNLLTGSSDKTARLWDRQGNLVREFKRHTSCVTSVAFSPDGKTILTGSSDKTARLWDLQGNLVREFKGHTAPVSSVAFSPDGKTILTGSSDKTARLWDLQGNLVREFKGHTEYVSSVAFSPDGKTILTGSSDKTARLWDSQGNLVREFKGHTEYVSSVAISPDGKTILTGSGDKTTRLWDLQGNLVLEFKGHKDDVTSVAFSPDGKSILTGSFDRTARLWSRWGRLLQEFKGHKDDVFSVAFSPDGKTLLTGSGLKDRTARLWKRQEYLLQEFKGHKGWVSSVAFSPDGKSLLTGSRDNTARLWNLQGNLVRELEGHTSSVTSVAFSPDGKNLLTVSGDTARLWDSQGKLVREFKGHTENVSSAAFSPDGKTILIGSGDTTARLWDLQGNLLREFKGHMEYVSSVAFSPDGKTLLTGSGDTTARLWDHQGILLQEFKGHKDDVTSVAFSPDGKTLLTGSFDRTARLWDLRGSLVQEFKGHKKWVLSVAFSPDGKTLLTFSTYNNVRLWDLKGNLLLEFKRHIGYGISTAFSPDRKTILIGSMDKTARLWDVPMPLEEFLEKGLCERLTKEQKKKYGIKD
jgi:WD40 repeat protein